MSINLVFEADVLYLISSVTAPATTGEATLVPESDRQPPLSTTHLKHSLYIA